MNWVSIGSCVKGASHIVSNMPCQDAIKIDEEKRYTIVSVADGHGSATSKYSDDGSKIATQVVYDYLCIAMSEGYEYFRTNKDIHIPKKIEQLWKEEVLRFHEKEGREACDQLECYKMYGTTLLTVVVSQEFIFALQIGDGSILYVTEEGETSYFIEMEKLLGTETHSLCLKESWKFFKSVLIKVSEDVEIPKLLILSTDGYENSFEGEEDFFAVGKDYMNIIKENGINKVSENLEKWLESTSEKGSGDDISVVLVYRGETCTSRR